MSRCLCRYQHPFIFCDQGNILFKLVKDRAFDFCQETDQLEAEVKYASWVSSIAQYTLHVDEFSEFNKHRSKKHKDTSWIFKK